MRGYKMGAQQEDINAIRRMTEEGKTVEEISRALLVIESCVQSFVDKFTKPKKPARKSKPKPKAEAVEAQPVEEDVPAPPPV